MPATRTIAVLGDLHANLSALQAVLAVLELEQVSELYCVGDVVGYGPRPNEVVERIREAGVRCVAGNHDWALLGRIDARTFNPYAQAALEWTGKELTAENRDFLAELPLRIDDPEFCVFHGSLPEPEAFNYLQSFPAARASLAEFAAPVGFCGHTHVPMNFIQHPRATELEWHFQTDWCLEDQDRAVVNVGSVGQPRDENPQAPVCLYELPARRFRLLRTPYNIAEEQKRIRRAGLPQILGDRLVHGI